MGVWIRSARLGCSALAHPRSSRTTIGSRACQLKETRLRGAASAPQTNLLVASYHDSVTKGELDGCCQ
jgi:hypothetical protein